MLTSVKKSTASPQVTDTLPLIIFMTGTDTHQHFIYHRSHHIHPWLKKTGTCLLKASNILLYYFVSTSLYFLPLYFLPSLKQRLSSPSFPRCPSLPRHPFLAVLTSLSLPSFPRHTFLAVLTSLSLPSFPRCPYLSFLSYNKDFPRHHFLAVLPFLAILFSDVLTSLSLPSFPRHP